jgi:HD superfamily phosphohydrolase
MLTVWTISPGIVFFTGVSEGVVGYDRILKMLTVHDGELMVEEKAIYSIEKFLVARRLMYWQVYLHKTVLVAEMMLVKIFQRVRQLGQGGDLTVVTDSPLSAFLLGNISDNMEDNLDLFCMLDDTDVVASIKKWSLNQDRVLSYLSKSILNRKLLKIRLQTAPIPEDELSARKTDACQKAGVDIMESAYLAFTGEAVNSLYNPFDERINILFKDNSVKNISMVDNALIHQNLSRPVKKFYICWVGDEK